jgi:hypothetical protein
MEMDVLDMLVRFRKIHGFAFDFSAVSSFKSSRFYAQRSVGDHRLKNVKFLSRSGWLWASSTLRAHKARGQGPAAPGTAGSKNLPCLFRRIMVGKNEERKTRKK